MFNIKDFRPLFMEKVKGSDWDFSLGRIAFWMCFLPAFYFWLFKDTDIHSSHLQMLYVMVTYNLAKKVPWLNEVPPHLK